MSLASGGGSGPKQSRLTHERGGWGRRRRIQYDKRKETVGRENDRNAMKIKESNHKKVTVPASVKMTPPIRCPLISVSEKKRKRQRRRES